MHKFVYESIPVTTINGVATVITPRPYSLDMRYATIETSMDGPLVTMIQSQTLAVEARSHADFETACM